MVKKFTCQSIYLIVLFFAINLPGFGQVVEGYYTTKLISYDTGYLIGNAPKDPRRFNAEKALGGPETDQYDFVSLGFAGEIVLAFPAPVKNGDGVDLIIHETSFGQTYSPCANWPEQAEIFVSQDAITWYSLGIKCRTAKVEFPEELSWILYVKIVDKTDPLNPIFQYTDDGYDVTYVESLHGWLGPVVPELECINDLHDGNYTAFLGYHNKDTRSIEIPVGEKNFFSSTVNAGQPQEFLEGQHRGVFFIEFDGNPFSWTLIGPDSVARTVEISSASNLCPVTLPTAVISGDAIICGPDAESTVAINLTGTAPWTIVYKNSNGEETTVITSEPIYTFTTSESTTFKIVSVSDVNGDGAGNGQATITVADIPSAEIAGGGNSCDETAPISIDLSGNGPWSFNLLKDDELLKEVTGWNSSSYKIDVTESGVYKFNNLNDAFCVAENDGYVEIAFKDLPDAILSGGGSLCHEEDEVNINIALTGTAPFEVTYFDGSQEHVLSNITDINVDLDINYAGNFSLISVSDAFCTGTVTGSALVEDNRLQVSLSAPEGICFGQDIPLTASVNGLYETVLWTSTGNGTFNNAASLNPVYTPAEGEKGEIEFSVAVSNSCGTTSDVMLVQIPEPLNAAFTGPNKAETYHPVVFTPVVSGMDSYIWSITNTSTNDLDADVLTHTFDQSGIYQVELIVAKKGCTGVAEMPIEVVETKKIIFVPNVFSPWATNPENQTVKVYGSGLSTEGFMFKILNRWGNVLFETTNLSVAQTAGWNGKAKGNGEMQALGVYTYMLQGKFLDGEIIEKTGSVTLVK